MKTKVINKLRNKIKSKLTTQVTFAFILLFSVQGFSLSLDYPCAQIGCNNQSAEDMLLEIQAKANELSGLSEYVISNYLNQDEILQIRTESERVKLEGKTLCSLFSKRIVSRDLREQYSTAKAYAGKLWVACLSVDNANIKVSNALRRVHVTNKKNAEQFLALSN